MHRSWRRSSIVGLGLLLASCGGHDSAVAPLPAAPSSPSSGAGAGYAMASSQGIAPEGFELKMKLDPRPGEDGIIRDGGPVTVEVDLCGSTADAGKTLHFLFDWDFNDLADVSGTGDTCVQKHSFRVPKDATKDVVLESNVCVTNGDPGVHNGSTYFSCRVVRVALPAIPPGCPSELIAPAGCYRFQGDNSFQWPGGSGPFSSVPYWDNSTTCSGPPDTDAELFAAACNQQQADALCLNAADLNTPVGDAKLYQCFDN